MNKKILLILMILLAVPLVMGATTEESSYIFKYNDTINVKIACFDSSKAFCSAGTNCTASINYPDGSSLVEGASMSYNAQYFNYSIAPALTNTEGDYSVVTHCVGTTNGYSTFNFKVTGNGRAEPEGVTIAIFVILFIIILVFLTYMIINTIGHFVEFDTDVKDVAFNLGAYIGLFSVYMLELYYVGNLQMERFLLLLIKITAFSNILLPFFAFAMTLIIQKLKVRREHQNG